ncbi:MAG: MarR family transcriptional regulator [Clostridia bacterium]|nr:MarR family transcriptional regulator [Clostridia bacterium]MDE6210708.1 MarR family transcriptional regulator [Clostridia bacterium]MDE6604720.1 MarR family transcriptional regulator [Clostridia bacterium]MDE6870178.1 MarR family transcriptional regulator [Clostridia bacterium]MDE7209459.1 MarR family transcriptional regulator [Clostridia bacterium]
MIDRFNTFTTLINKISRSILKIKTKEMSKFGLKSTHVSCLYYMYKNEGKLTARQLCDICLEDKAAISRSLEYLEEHGYISCDAKKEKRYKSQLCLTEQGEKTGREIAEIIDNILSKSDMGLTKDEMAVFYKCLAVLSNNLESISQRV